MSLETVWALIIMTTLVNVLCTGWNVWKWRDLKNLKAQLDATREARE